MADHFANLLLAFGKEIGIDGLTPDANGACTLFFDDTVVNVEMNDVSGLMFMYAAVGDLPVDGREGLYAALLQANAFYRGTQGASLGIDENAGVVVLQYQVPVLSLDEGRFSRTMENFVNVAETWTLRIREVGTGEARSTENVEAPPMGVRV